MSLGLPQNKVAPHEMTIDDLCHDFIDIQAKYPFTAHERVVFEHLWAMIEDGLLEQELAEV